MIPKTLPGEKGKKVDTIVQLNVTGSQAGQWNAVIKDGKVNVSKGVHTSPELTVTADTADVLAVADGKLDPTQALMQGKAQVKVICRKLSKWLKSSCLVANDKHLGEELPLPGSPLDNESKQKSAREGAFPCKK